MVEGSRVSEGKRRAVEELVLTVEGRAVEAVAGGGLNSDMFERGWARRGLLFFFFAGFAARSSSSDLDSEPECGGPLEVRRD